MKKILYSLMAVSLFFTSCANFDDLTTENYGEGPSVAIKVSEISDNAFTFTVTPAEGTMYYSVLVAEGNEAETLDAETLYKCGYKADYGTVLVDAAKNATFTYDMKNEEGKSIAKPNTTYQIYAVAANKYGVIGEIAVMAATTTDTSLPGVVDYEFDAENKAQFVAFSENVYRGEGAVKVQYYKLMELMQGTVAPIEVAAEEVVVQIQSNQAAIVAPTTPAGAYVAISWEEGAFVDGKGNKIKAVNSGFSTTEGDFVGLYGQNATVAFEITEKNVAAPALGTSFGDPSSFMGEIAFDFDIFANPELPESGALSVTYTNSVSTKTIKLTNDYWVVNGKKLYFVLPEACEVGDVVTVTVAEDVIMDIYGNPNAEFALENGWLCSFGLTREDVVGNYNLVYTSYFDKKQYAEAISIAVDPDSKDGVLINNMFAEGTSFKAAFDGDYGTITIPSETYLGTYNFTIDAAGNKAPLHVLLVDGNGGENIVWQFASDGSFTPTPLWGYYLINAETNESVDFYDVASVSKGVKVASSASVAAAPKFAANKILKSFKLK